MTPPTIAQQRGMAYAPMPFAIASLLSSCFVIHHILFQRPQKRRRLYHRLVLAMNVAVAPLSLNYLLGPLAVPEGTPHSAIAAGNIQSCTAAGFTAIMLTMTVPIYYGSLGLQAYLSIKNEFGEEKYGWVERWVHLVAWVVPCGISGLIAAYENFNPAGSGCSIAASPPGCGADAGVPCQRGGGIQMQYFTIIVAFCQVLFYFVVPPSGMVAVHRLITKMQMKSEMGARTTSMGDEAKRGMMRNVAIQISVYLFSFWATFLPSVIFFLHLTLTGTVLYNLDIFAICIFASQGSILAGVYFLLPRISRLNVTPDVAPNATGNDADETAEGQARRGAHPNIFDGTLEEDSPWAEFFRDESDPGDDGGPPPELPPELRWRPEEGDAGRNLDMREKLYLYENVLRL